jgi:hypothetical protein
MAERVAERMPERVITVRLTSADLNLLLARAPGLDVTFAAGRFTVRKVLALVTLTAEVIPEAEAGRWRLVVPFSRVRADKGAGWLVRGALRAAWHWLDANLDRFVAEKLEAQGLPWDLLWVDGGRDEQGGKVVSVHLSPAVLNAWLAQRPLLGPYAARVVGAKIEPEALLLTMQLAPVEG